MMSATDIRHNVIDQYAIKDAEFLRARSDMIDRENGISMHKKRLKQISEKFLFGDITKIDENNIPELERRD